MSKTAFNDRIAELVAKRERRLAHASARYARTGDASAFETVKS